LPAGQSPGKRKGKEAATGQTHRAENMLKGPTKGKNKGTLVSKGKRKERACRLGSIYRKGSSGKKSWRSTCRRAETEKKNSAEGRVSLDYSKRKTESAAYFEGGGAHFHKGR